jgi:hypothetical protein
VVDDLAVVLVEASRQVRLGCCQPDGVANTLAQGTCVSRSSGGWKSDALHCLQARARAWRAASVHHRMRTSRNLHARGQEVLRVTRRLALPLPELLQVINLLTTTVPFRQLDVRRLRLSSVLCSCTMHMRSRM